ncbi:hypothetical protein F207_070 [Campylobacter phage F207]|uniref:Uncharacterized protein n=2 Tax=Fletchervirus TaxID=1636618 RepID=A0A7T3KDP9_9CAUD|nr:hypothetical protein D302_gp149 [Campylobacter phage CP30A]AFR52461.1 hypothetical protein [Campylobacter phage CP30A]QPX62870.1 hypothetical protein F207_070 [Campylobacter phage F207]
MLKHITSIFHKDSKNCKCKTCNFGEFKKLFTDKVVYLKLTENNLKWYISECPKCKTIKMFSLDLSIISPSKLEEYISSKHGVIGKIKKISEVEKELLDILNSEECKNYCIKNDISLTKYINNHNFELFNSRDVNK